MIERVSDCWDFFGFLAEGFEGEFAIACGARARRLGVASHVMAMEFYPDLVCHPKSSKYVLVS